MDKFIGNYQIECELGSGGFGIVYRGKHSILTERTVAIKVLHSHLGSPEMRDQFLREARFLEKLKHPNILHIFDVGVDQGFPYLVSEYAPNGSLRDRLKRSAPHLLPEQEVVAILSQVGEALYYAHQQNIVHRDLKPENILFNAEGSAFLADFGVATTLSSVSVKQTSITGSPPYMAPEQFQGAVCKESDQYALGCIAYELVTGRPPFQAPDFFALGFQHLSAPLTPPGQLNPTLSNSIEQAILKALAKQRADRHADVRAFITALQESPAQQTRTDYVGPTVISPTYAPTYVLPPRAHLETPVSPTDIASAYLPLAQARIDTNQQDETNIVTKPSNGHVAIQQQQDAIISLPTQISTLPVGSQVHQSPITPVLPLPVSFIDIPFDSTFEDTSEPQRNGLSKHKWLIVAATSLLVVASLLGVLLLTAFAHDNNPATTGQKRLTVVLTHTATAPIVTRTASSAKEPTPPTSGSKTSPMAPVPTYTSSGTTATPAPGSAAIAVSPSAPSPNQPVAPPTQPVAPPTQPVAPPNTETVTAYLFNGLYAVHTSHSYSGTVTITVGGVGQSFDVTAYSDAFYVYTDAQGNLVTPRHGTSSPNWVMAISGQHTDAFVSTPPYNPNHTYTFTMTAPGGSLSFGVDDNVTADNTGAYTVTVTQN